MNQAQIVGVIVAGIVAGIVEIGRSVFNAFKSDDVELAKRRVREAADRAVDKAFALWRLAQRKAQKAKSG